MSMGSLEPSPRARLLSQTVMRLLPPLLTAILLAIHSAASVPPGPGKPQRSLVRELDPAEAVKADPALSMPDLISRAEELLGQGGRLQIERARRLLTFALELDPGSGPVHIALARVEAAAYSRRWVEDDALIEKALKHGRRAVEALPEEAQAHAALAVGHLIGEEWDEGFEEAEKAWRLRKETTPIWVTQLFVQTLIARAETTRALEILDESLARWPGRPHLFALKGAALMEKADPGAATIELHRAVYLDEDFVPALLLLGRSYDLTGNRTAAGQIYKQIVDRFPEEKARVHILMAATLIARGRHEEALFGLAQVSFGTKRGLGMGTLVYLRAACHEGMGMLDDARQEYREVLRDYPLASFGSFSPERLASSAYEGLARIEISASRTDEAARIMEEAMLQPRPHLKLFLNLALIYKRYNLPEDAIEVLRRAAAIDFGPRQSGAKVAVYVAWARALAERSETDPAARAELLHALDSQQEALLATGDVAIYLEAARAAAVAGDPGAGLVWLERAAERGYRTMDWVSKDPEMREISRLPGFAALAQSAP